MFKEVSGETLVSHWFGTDFKAIFARMPHAVLRFGAAVPLFGTTFPKRIFNEVSSETLVFQLRGTVFKAICVRMSHAV